MRTYYILLDLYKFDITIILMYTTMRLKYLNVMSASVIKTNGGGEGHIQVLL